MHCSDELRNQFNSHALMLCYTLFPCITSCGTRYRPIASPLPQLSILLLLDYGWYSGLGLRCGYLGVFLACVLGAYLLAVFWRERAAWLLVNVYRGKMRSGLLPEGRVVWDGDGECSLSAP
jgi:hypothetical protein